MRKTLKRIFFKKENIALALILLVGGFLRLYRISEYLTFLGDEGRDVLVVKHILDGNLTLLGPTASVGGFFLGPIYYYMMAPFLFLFNFNPVGPAVMVALFGVATIWLVYRVTREFFGYYPALISSLLYAISPLVIIYSKSSWNPNTVPFFTLLMLFTLYRGFIKKSNIYFFLSGVILGILLQLHYLTTFLGVLCGVYILVGTFYANGKKVLQSLVVVLKRYGLFAGGIVIGWSPFLAFEVRHGFPNVQSISEFVLSSGETGNNGQYFKIVSDVFLRLFGRLLLAFPRVEDLHLYSQTVLDMWGFASYTIGFASILICLVGIVYSFRKKSVSFYKFSLLILWLLVCVLLFGFYKKAIYDYYFGILFPLPFILFGGLVSYAFRRGKVVSTLILIGLLAMVGINLYNTPIFYPRNNQLKQVRSISEFVLSKTDGKPFNFAVISSGGNSDFAYRYFFEVNEKIPVTIEFPGADPKRNTITDQLLIVCESVPCQPLGYPLWEVAGFGQAEIVGEWSVSVVKVYKLVHYKPEK